jgi:hypothetical protein
VVLGASPLEDAPGMIARAPIALALGLWASTAAGQADSPPASPPAAATPAPPPGPSGSVWGRLSVEEESPDGPWTPLAAVEVQVYPASASLLVELERIRQSARDSGRLHDTAVSRLQGALRTYQTQLEKRGEGGAAPVRRQTTDAAGLFAFEDLPVGDWLLVAIRVAPYGNARLRAAPSPRPGGRRSGPDAFVPRAQLPAKEAEIWLREFRLRVGERQALALTDRARWFDGPVR